MLVIMMLILFLILKEISMQIVLLGKFYLLAFRTLLYSVVRHYRGYVLNRILETTKCSTLQYATLEFATNFVSLLYKNHLLNDNQRRDYSKYLMQSKHLKGH